MEIINKLNSFPNFGIPTTNQQQKRMIKVMHHRIYPTLTHSPIFCWFVISINSSHFALFVPHTIFDDIQHILMRAIFNRSIITYLSFFLLSIDGMKARNKWNILIKNWYRSDNSINHQARSICSLHVSFSWKIHHYFPFAISLSSNGFAINTFWRTSILLHFAQG